tara:strand:- start:1694 stop:2515 length:822 start_codon:yes stop_codon:yes gene_type:complete
MSINDITNAAAAMNALKVRYQEFFDDTDNDIGQRRAAYDGLASDLSGIVDNKLTATFYIDAENGDDTSDKGNVPNPLNTLAEAFSRMVPGGKYIVKLFGDQTHIIQDSLNASNAHISIDRYGGENRPRMVSLTSSSHPTIDYCTNIQLFNSSVYVTGVDLETELAEKGSPHFSSGMFSCSNDSSVKTLYSDVLLGDFPIVVTNAGHFCSFVFQHGNVSREDGSIQNTKMMYAQTGSIFISSASVPAGDAWSDYVNVIRDANGASQNIISNLVL